MNRKLLAAASIVVLAIAIGGGAYAVKAQDKNDVMTVVTAKIDLIQAITAAEQHVGGKAASAELERDDGRWLYEVEVIKDKSVIEVKIDPDSGQVISAVEEKDD